MKYKIGTVARLLGVSPQTLRLYEQNGILTSERGEGENGYRYYSRLDITALMRARAYHQYGFSMKETEGLINAGDVDYVLEEYRRRARELEAELFLKQRILEYLRQMSSLLEQLPGQLWTIRRAVSPGIYRLEFMKGDQLILTPEQMEIFPHWVGLAPFAFPSQRNSWEGILRGQDISYSALGVMEEDARALNMPAPLRGGATREKRPGRFGAASGFCCFVCRTLGRGMLGFRPLEQSEAIAREVQHACLAQFPQLGRQGAAVDG